MSEPEPLVPRWRLARAAHAGGSTTDIPINDGLALGRNLLGSEYAFVSRTQAKCRLVGSSLIVVSHGTNPTGVKAKGADSWVWIGKGQQLCVQSGDRIALDQRKLCSTVLTVHMDAPASVRAASAVAASASTGSAAVATSLPLPPPPPPPPSLPRPSTLPMTAAPQPQPAQPVLPASRPPASAEAPMSEVIEKRDCVFS